MHIFLAIYINPDFVQSETYVYRHTTVLYKYKKVKQSNGAGGKKNKKKK